MILIDYLIIVVLLGTLFAISVVVSRRKASAEQFFLAGRNLTWPFIGFALIAVNIDAGYAINFAGSGYADGVLYGHYEVGATLCLLVLVFALLPLYRASGIYTMPQLLRQRFGDSTHLIYSVIAIFGTFLTLPVGTNAIAKTLSALTGLSMWWFAAATVMLPALPLAPSTSFGSRPAP